MKSRSSEETGISSPSPLLLLGLGTAALKKFFKPKLKWEAISFFGTGDHILGTDKRYIGQHRC